MNQFVITVPDPRHVPFVRELLAQLSYVQIEEEPALSPEEEAREDAAAQAAYERAKANPAPEFLPWDEVKQAIREDRDL